MDLEVDLLVDLVVDLVDSGVTLEVDSAKNGEDHSMHGRAAPCNIGLKSNTISSTRILGALRASTSSRRPFWPLDFVL